MSSKSKHWTLKKNVETVCVVCGKTFLACKANVKYCSRSCRRKPEVSKLRGWDKLTKTCPECGTVFDTTNSRKIYCSTKCKKSSRHDFGRWKREHPNAKSKEEIHKEKLERDRVKAEERERYIEEMERRKADREKKKQDNIAYWQNYKAIHNCEVCGCDFEANYPLTKYCSDKCRSRAYRKRNRYKEITVDRGINLYKLAKRDNNICQLCGLRVDWEDYSKTDSTIVCGNMYPSIDHVKPISLGGLHSWDNVQLAHRICNTRKNNRFIG